MITAYVAIWRSPGVPAGGFGLAYGAYGIHLEGRPGMWGGCYSDFEIPLMAFGIERLLREFPHEHVRVHVHPEIDKHISDPLGHARTAIMHRGGRTKAGKLYPALGAFREIINGLDQKRWSPIYARKPLSVGMKEAKRIAEGEGRTAIEAVRAEQDLTPSRNGERTYSVAVEGRCAPAKGE